MPEFVATTKLFAGAPPPPAVVTPLIASYFNEAILMWRLEHLNHSSI